MDLYLAIPREQWQRTSPEDAHPMGMLTGMGSVGKAVKVEPLGGSGGSSDCPCWGCWGPPWDTEDGGRGAWEAARRCEGPHLAVSPREIGVLGLRAGRRGPPMLGDSSPGDFLSRTSQSPQGGFLRRWIGRKEKGRRDESEKVGRGSGSRLFVTILLGAQGAPSLPAENCPCVHLCSARS